MIRTVIAQIADGVIVDILDSVIQMNGLNSSMMAADVDCTGTETNISEIAGWDAARAAVVRAERDQKLLACDWTQLADSPLDATTKANWATYRQELRDVPTLTNFPNNFTWPTEPI